MRSMVFRGMGVLLYSWNTRTRANLEEVVIFFQGVVFTLFFFSRVCFGSAGFAGDGGLLGLSPVECFGPETEQSNPCTCLDPSSRVD